jgi:TolB protein
MSSGRGIPSLDGAEIVRIDPVSGGVTQLTHAGDEGRSATSPAWSPDGERIAFVMGDMHQPTALAGIYDIYVMGADGSGVQGVTQGINAQLPTWSPDGRSIAFVRDQGAAISVVDLATGSIKDIYVPKARQIVQAPSWSPDGSRIAFQMGPESVDIYTVNLSTGDLTRFTDDGDSGYPAWSPDGSRIAFRRGDNIWVMSASGTGATRITTCFLPCVGSFAPVWSPDGSTLAFVRQGHGGASLQLFEIGVDGDGLRQLTSGLTEYSNPSLRPGDYR